MVFIASSIFAAVLGMQAAPGQAADVFFATDADPFLGKCVATRESIHASIEASLRKDDVEAHLAMVQAELSPTYTALPHNKYKRLNSASVRYLLHRYFLHHRAWLVRGLAPDGDAWTASFPTQILQGGAPAEVRSIVAEHLKGRGLSLREVAVLAVMLENQVHDDAVDKLHKVWSASDLKPDETIDLDRMKLILESHTMMYAMEDYFKARTISSSSLADARSIVGLVLPLWPRTQNFLLETLKAVAHSQTSRLGFSVAEGTVTQVLREYGRWQDGECRELRHALVDLESRKSGRIDLSDFYNEAVNGKHSEFSESLPYLRNLGVLDESDPDRLAVIIPNWMNSPGNYILSSPHFAVACIDWCEDILAQIENEVQDSKATTEQLMSIVKDLPATPGALMTDDLWLRLEDIASVHGGQVPLHGRLFQMWMHHAYPTECPLPHVAGTTHPLLPEVFRARTGLPYVETVEGMKRYIQQHTPKHDRLDPEPLPWDFHEELLQEEDSPWMTGMDFKIAAAAAALFALTTVMLSLQLLRGSAGARGSSLTGALVDRTNAAVPIESGAQVPQGGSRSYSV